MNAARKKEMCNSLIQWFQTLQLQAPHSTALELSDGVAMAQALHQIAPDTFTAGWLAKIKFEVGSNWRLKVSNLKKVSAGAMEYYADCLQLQLHAGHAPDVLAIAEKQCDAELGVLLQLVLGCAVNCPDKQDYITQIMGLEESLQRNIMTALQELETVWQGLTTPGAGASAAAAAAASGTATTPTAAQRTAAAHHGGNAAAASSAAGSAAAAAALSLATGNQTADALAQRCHEAERKCALLLDEKFTLQLEVAKMQEELDRSAAQHSAGTAAAMIGDDGVSLGPVQPGSTRYTELRRQLDAMKDELLMAETQRDDFKIRATQQEKELLVLQQRSDELTKTADELVTVKDEVDALRESAERLKVCEAQLVTFKKKLEEFNDLRRQVKLLEERNADVVQQSLAQEEQLKKGGALKSQLELYKKEIEELHGKLDAEMMKSVKTEFELSNVAARCTALQREKESLLNERDQLRETVDELKCTQVSSDGGETMRAAMGKELLAKEQRAAASGALDGAGSGADGGGELTVTAAHEAFVAQFMVESNQRVERLREQLKAANQKILFFEAQAASLNANESPDTVLQQLKQALEQNERKATQLDDAHTQLAQHQSKIFQLEASLAVRDQELSVADARYRKSVEKTKEIIRSYDPSDAAHLDNKTGSPGNDSNSNSTDVSAAAAATDAQPETARPAIDAVEERLMATAYYRLSLSCHRDAMEARLALLNGAGQSFLNRQRQPAARKPQNGAPTQSAFKK